jgi:hypothetical protein
MAAQPSVAQILREDREAREEADREEARDAERRNRLRAALLQQPEAEALGLGQIVPRRRLARGGTIVVPGITSPGRARTVVADDESPPPTPAGRSPTESEYEEDDEEDDEEEDEEEEESSRGGKRKRNSRR